METEFKDSILLVDGNSGIYVPQSFVEAYDAAEWGISPEDESILNAGPDHEHYWDVWDDVLRDASYTDDNGNVWHLWQDGDLFAVQYND